LDIPAKAHALKPFLSFKNPGDIQKRSICVRSKFNWTVDPDFSRRYAKFVCQLNAEDPRIYADQEYYYQAVCNPTATIKVSNPGTMPVYPHITILGPVSSQAGKPQITYLGSSYMGVQMSSILIIANQALSATPEGFILDFFRRQAFKTSVFLDGATVTNIYGSLGFAASNVPAWFAIVPDNELRRNRGFAAGAEIDNAITVDCGTGTSAGTTVRIAYRPAWN
jgi:hypothetical protein